MPQTRERTGRRNLGRGLIVLLLSGALLIGVLVAILHATSKPSFCASCHEMRVPYYQMWQESQHRDVDCVSCHVEKGFMPLLRAKTTRSFHDLYAHFITGFETPIRQTHPVENQICLGCHPDGSSLPDRDLEVRHDVHTEKSVQCGECHLHTSHTTAERAVSLARDPASCEECHQAHTNFPLTGAHVSLTCADCHAQVGYQQVDPACKTCHQENDFHDGRLGQDCAQCHVTDSWQQATFDHGLAAFQLTGAHIQVACDQCHVNNILQDTPQECVACHAQPDIHLDQFGVDCASCHTTDAWSAAVFDHTGFSDCQNCHAAAAPADHYPGQCSQCHTGTETWGGAIFDHAGFTDCQSCHASTVPANHYPGQCSQCHASTETWSGAIFNHAGFTDCQGCHAATAPPNHFPNQCSWCHTPNSWSQVSLPNHTFPINHGGAGGHCATCHSNNDITTYTCFNCHDQAGIAGEHREEGVGDFANCVQCHPTGDD